MVFKTKYYKLNTYTTVFCKDYIAKLPNYHTRNLHFGQSYVKFPVIMQNEKMDTVISLKFCFVISNEKFL